MMNVGIIGAGHIAEKAARTLAQMDGFQCLAIGSRSLEKAQAFAGRFGIPRAYGSYADLLQDPDIGLVYIATPHSCHFEQARDAILEGKPCLVEKSFMMNAVEAAAILALAREKGVFIAEAMWPRYMPVRTLAREVLASGVIGKPLMLTATLAYNVSGKERVQRPELGGGALLDLGVYLLNFVRMYCDSPIRDLSTSCIRATTGVDASEVITCIHEDGTLSSVQASGFSQGVNEGVFDDLINPTCLRICRKGHILEREIPVPKQITGFEYQFQACADAISAGRLEPAQMPHAETLYIMHLMDRLRTEWGVPTSSVVK